MFLTFRAVVFNDKCELCHVKTCLKIFVVVIPKEGLVGGDPPIWYDTNYRILWHASLSLYMHLNCNISVSFVYHDYRNQLLSTCRLKLFGWWSFEVLFAGDPTSLAHDNIICEASRDYNFIVRVRPREGLPHQSFFFWHDTDKDLKPRFSMAQLSCSMISVAPRGL